MKPESSPRQLFRLLVIFRWVSLVPALISLLSASERPPDIFSSWALFLSAVLVNLLITLAADRLNEILKRNPWVLLFDLAFSVGLMLVTGGGAGPYFLHSLGPLMAAAFFFQLRGGFLASLAYSVLFLMDLPSIGLFNRSDTDFSSWVSQLAAAWVIPAVIGRLSRISEDLQSAHEEANRARAELSKQNLDLSETHQRLKTIHDLTLLLQAAPDVRSMQEQVLFTLSRSLRYPRALLGLLKPGTPTFYAWKALEDGEIVPFDLVPGSLPISMNDPNSPRLAEIMGSLHPGLVSRAEIVALPHDLGAWLGPGPALFLPLIFHEVTVGLLVLPADDVELNDDDEHFTLVRTLANQAATSLGTTMLCVERAQDLAVEQERNRIAREIHDTVSQSLFGMIYSLDACIRMLPDSVDIVRKELIELQSLANLTRDQVRHSIFDLWPSSLTLEIFQSDLNHYVSHCFRLVPFDIRYDVQGDFESLSPAIRRNLYRITQEALTNTLHHAGVDQAEVHLLIADRAVDLIIEDRGIGFDVDNALSREYSREHFGLHGIRERSQAMGGECTILSAPGSGSKVQVHVPLRQSGRVDGS